MFLPLTSWKDLFTNDVMGKSRTGNWDTQLWLIYIESVRKREWLILLGQLKSLLNINNVLMLYLLITTTTNLL